jgi:hypothetical protein
VFDVSPTFLWTTSVPWCRTSYRRSIEQQFEVDPGEATTMTSAAVAMSGRGRPVEDRRQNRAAVRLTRRGRAVAVLCVLALAVALGLLLRQPSSEAGAETRPHAAYEYVVVPPGETLWQIAERVAPDVDPRVTIMRIQDLNGLPDAAVAAGQRIALPPHG